MKKIMSIMLVVFLLCLLSVSCRNVYIMDMLPEVDDEAPGLADAAPRPVMISSDESLSRMIESRGAYDVEGHTSKMYLFFCPAIAGFSSEVYEEEEYEDELYDFGISFTRTKWNEKKYSFTGRGEKVYFDVDYDDDLRSYSFLQIVKMDGVDIDPESPVMKAQDYYVVSKSDGPIIYDEASSSWQGTTSTYVWMDDNSDESYNLLLVSSGDYFADGITAGVFIKDPFSASSGEGPVEVTNPQINFGQANELTEKADEPTNPEEPGEDVETKTVKCTEIPADWEGFDIGQETIKIFREELKNAKTVVWNGPLGVFEIDKFAIGTNEIAKALADIDATTIIGGGDSAAAVKKAGLEDKMTHISTGGGASLEFLEGKKLPGIECLMDK